MEAKRKAEAEEVGMEQGSASLSKQKERAEGELIMCDHCATWGAECLVSDQFCTCTIVCFTDDGK